ASASWPATPGTRPSAPTSTAASAANRRRATWTPSPTCSACPTCSGNAATPRRTSKASCTVTGCGSSRRPGPGGKPMGVEQTVRHGGGVTWEAVRDFLGQRGYPLTLRMIDGELAFPDEAPPPTWRELRVGTPQGMVTLRRGGDGLAVVTWGNADAALRQAW